jgi:chromosome segregation ATPase
MNAEQIFTSLLTGNFGYGILMFIFVIVFFVYRIFVKPGLERKDELEIDIEANEKLHAEDIRAKEAQLKEFQELIEQNHEIIAEQQATIAKLTDINSEKDQVLKNVTANDGLITNVAKLETSIRELLDGVESHMETNAKTLASVVEEMETKVLPKLDEGNSKVIENFRHVEQTIQSMTQGRMAQHEEVTGTLARVHATMGELRSMFAARGMSAAQQTGNVDSGLDSAMQQVK